EMRELHEHLCNALSDPKRLLIINELRDGPCSVAQVAAALGTSEGDASKHLSLLLARGVLTREQHDGAVCYSLTSPKIVQAVDLLRRFMAEDLGRQPTPHPAAAG
ncbi:MAG: ArsR/SmtB family transcription factor, partial [Mycobacteriales bacterium]